MAARDASFAEDISFGAIMGVEMRDRAFNLRILEEMTGLWRQGRVLLLVNRYRRISRPRAGTAGS
jgi:hypothetical protein